MSPGFIRAKALIKKELRAVLRDPQSRRMLIGPVILQLVLFPAAATREVKNNVVAIYDEDGGAVTAEITQRLTQTPAFSKVVRVGSDQEARAIIERQDAIAVLRFGPRFSAAVAEGRPEPVQAVLDGRRSSAAQIAVGYVGEVLAGIPLKQTQASASGGGLFVRHWFNPNLEYFRFIVPSLVAIITTLSALIVTAMSVSREREQGTLEQLLVSPLTPSLIFFGKAVPALFIAAAQATIILSGGVFIYGIPFQGALGLLYLCMVAYVAALAGIGLLISSFASTQQQAFLGTFCFVMPAILISGYISPVDNMPSWLRTVAQGNPLLHFIVIVKGLYLKAAPFSDLVGHVGALMLIACVTTAAALLVFRRRLA
ncbi:MAG: ABC transporter permease [Myxococcota bacterium]|nr:ABC transporter permease [Myxococcota bacterium]